MEKLLSLDEVTEILGIKKGNLRLKIRNNEIPYFFKIGRLWKIKEGDLEKWIEEQKNKSSRILRETEESKRNQKQA